MTIEEFESFFNLKKEKIKTKVLGKYGIESVDLGAQPKRGRLKDEKAHLVCETFGLNIFTLRVWRSGKAKLGRQKLYALLMSLPFDVLEQISKMEEKQ